MLVDALGSFGALVAGLLSMFLPLEATADAIASVVIGILVLGGGWTLLRDSTRVLLEFARRSAWAEGCGAGKRRRWTR